MAKRNLEWNQNKLRRYLDEGRGQGIGKDYKPWLTIQDFPSMGRVSRVYSNKTGRVHHFFSDNETRMFYLLHWEDSVIDIREHFPLLDIGQVIEDKRGLDLEKFVDKQTGTPFIFSTTFLVTIKVSLNRESYIARSVKSANELEKKHIIEKFELERRYWESKGIDWGIVTQKDIPVIKAKNIEWVYSALDDSEERGIDNGTKMDLSKELIYKLMNSSNAVRKITALFDDEFQLEKGTGLYLFKYLIATKRIKVDMEQKININLSADELIQEVEFEGGVRHGKAHSG
ncbi:TnsA endonuclease C-terminal domain-containing protein [Tissierella praeacuta]|uniref:TnsA endonuclease C-terminal domain-containing protein n=1 Tax=Tissierella praeacuta TaxID=43131 RepID=UPI001C1007DB|nr:TnsA endonuclease C-terminal domain-containing protein [Tissierella praeacuta]MBU5257498.1 TnsA endonuclease C-terminal domain-containing protein [Tissierella praeacuta]